MNPSAHRTTAVAPVERIVSVDHLRGPLRRRRYDTACSSGVYDMAVARTGPSDHEAFPPGSTQSQSSLRPTTTRPITQPVTASGCASTVTAPPRRLLGVQVLQSPSRDVAKRIEIVARLLTKRCFFGQVVVVPASKPRPALSEIIHQWVDCSMFSSFIEAVEGPRVCKA